ncbi:MAG: hypothetical protein COY40_01655 [Alphaproteobacteria bacterium CG_4_10_14_0_8_um_filter_53_9]|nr:MAG: hypothetical protein COY40_01655 [Alphaproteobacteria bacterium CG_4_10_14_0_8_um_filter_53_9]
MVFLPYPGLPPCGQMGAQQVSVKPPANIYLFPWERATHVADDMIDGWLDARWLGIVSTGAGLMCALTLYTVAGWGGAFLGVVLGRMLAFDLVGYVLPDVYTLPLVAVAAAFALSHGMGDGRLLGAVLLGVAYMGMMRFQPRIGLGGGDLKLMAAMLLAMGPFTFWTSTLAACVLWAPFAFWQPKKAIPFGVPLLIGSILMFIGLRYTALGPIS